MELALVPGTGGPRVGRQGGSYLGGRYVTSASGSEGCARAANGRPPRIPRPLFAQSGGAQQDEAGGARAGHDARACGRMDG